MGLPHREGELLDLVGAFYDSAIDPACWPHALERLTRLVDGEFAAISLHDTSEASVRLQAHWNVKPEFEASMRENFAINPLVPLAWYSEIDRPYTAVGFLGEDDLRNSKWHRQAVAPHRMFDAVMTFLARSANQFVSLSIFRDERKAVFGPDALEVVQRIAPHIRRAVMIADLLDARALERDMLSTTLELLAVGIVLTDETGRIVHANHAALGFLDDGRALRRDGDRLAARDPKDAFELRQAIAEAASGSTINIPHSGIAVPISGQDGPDLAAWVLPLDGGLRHNLAADFTAKAAVFVRRWDAVQPFPAELFVRRYAITPAECRLLVLLVQGMTVTEAADTLGIALPTAKTHLARLFHKTGTQRQADLVRLAMGAFAPAAASRDGG